MVLIKKYAKKYFVDALDAMAFGFFATLIIGVILNEITRIPGLDFIQPIADFCRQKEVVGAAIGLSIAYAFKNHLLVIASTAVVGAMGYSLGKVSGGALVIGGPIGAYIAAIIGAEIGSLISGKTKIDILLTPLVTVIVGGIVAILIAPPIGELMIGIGNAINKATDLAPLPMSIILSVVIGMLLTAPVSSAAICISLNLSGLAAGAATIGCSVQMIGFAVMSYRQNGIGGFLSIGFGTSMLQFTNIVKKPTIWLPTIISSAIIAPFATLIFKMTNIKEGAGMGTSGLVGQIGTFSAMKDSEPFLNILLKVGLLHFALPIILVLLFHFLFLKIKLYQDSDLKLKTDI